MNINNQNELITFKEACFLLGANIHALRYAVRTSKIPYSIVGGKVYFNRSKLTEWLNRRLEASVHRYTFRELRQQQRAITKEIRQAFKRPKGGGSR